MTRIFDRLPIARSYACPTFFICKCMHCIKKLQIEDIQFLEIGDNSYEKEALR